MNKLSPKNLRERTGLTQAQFAKKLRIHGQFVSNWERGLAPIPPKYFPKISALCDIPVLTLINLSVHRYREHLIEQLSIVKWDQR